MIDAYHLYLNAGEVIVRRETGWWRWRHLEDVARWRWDAAAPATLNLDLLALRRHRHATLAVYAGSALGKFMILDLPAGLQGRQEEHAAAQAQMQHQLGLNPAQWELTVDHLPASGKAVACALRADISARIRQLARERGMRLQSLRPYAAIAWNTLQRRSQSAGKPQSGSSALMLVEADAFTIFMAKKGVIEAINALGHRREADLVNREIRRMAYALGDDAHRRIRLAVVADLLPLAQLHADKIVRSDDDRLLPHADFRDLLLQAPAQVAP